MKRDRPGREREGGRRIKGLHQVAPSPRDPFNPILCLKWREDGGWEEPGRQDIPFLKAPAEWKSVIFSYGFCILRAKLAKRSRKCPFSRLSHPTFRSFPSQMLRAHNTIPKVHFSRFFLFLFSTLQQSCHFPRTSRRRRRLSKKLRSAGERWTDRPTGCRI